MHNHCFHLLNCVILAFLPLRNKLLLNKLYINFILHVLYLTLITLVRNYLVKSTQNLVKLQNFLFEYFYLLFKLCDFWHRPLIQISEVRVRCVLVKVRPNVITLPIGQLIAQLLTDVIDLFLISFHLFLLSFNLTSDIFKFFYCF